MHIPLNEERLRYLESDVKCFRISTESYGKNEYIVHKNISDRRNHFRARFGSTTFAANYTHASSLMKAKVT